MSKGNMLLGHARGKVGDLVFSRSNGQQVVRARASVVRNPKTESQIIQRIILNTISQAYSMMRPIVDHSIEGATPGQETMSKFMSDNLKWLRANVANIANYANIRAFSPIGTSDFALNAYQVAKGSLPSVNISSLSIEGDTDNTFLMALTDNTYGGVIARYGLQRGDQLTFIFIHKDDDGNARFSYNRVILDPRDANGNELPLSTAFVTGSAITSPSAKNEGSFSILRFVNGSGVQFAEGESSTMVAAAVIVSRKGSDGNWLRSSANLVIKVADAAKRGVTLQEAITLAENTAIDTTSPLYLNNSGTANNISTTTSGGGTGGNTGGGGDNGGDDDGPSGE